MGAEKARAGAPGGDGSDPARPVIVLSVGRAVEKKGYDDLLTALAQLPPDLAWRFVAFMTSPETEKLIAVKAFRAPPRVALYDDADVLAANPQFARFAAAFRAAVPRPISPVYPAISSVLQRYFSQALVLDAADIAAHAREADQEIDRYLEMVP